MIYQLHGTLTARVPHGFVLTTAAGVGYQVLCAARTVDFFAEQQQAEVWIFTHMKDSGLYLYGFGTQREREFFGELTSINGVGPKMALQLLEALTVSEILQAATTEEHRAFMQVSGVGERTARKLALEIKHRLPKLQALLPPLTTEQASPHAQQQEEVVSALLNMGFAEKSVRSALVGFDWQRGKSTAVVLRQALQMLTHSAHSVAQGAQ